MIESELWVQFRDDESVLCATVDDSYRHDESYVRYVPASFLISAEQKRVELLSLLKEVTSLWPHVNCVCGRNKQRISDNLREKIEAVIKGCK